MKIIDINQNLRPPDGYYASGVTAEGSYLRVDYTRSFWPKGPSDPYKPTTVKESIVHIYLNDMGRPVLITEDAISRTYPGLAPEVKVTRGKKFRAAWQQFKESIREMIRCLK